jgi:hypothetical protein
MRNSCLVAIFLSMILATSVANAQANYVGLSGVVTDPHRLAIPFADVTLTSERLGLNATSLRTLTVSTNWEGSFRGLMCWRRVARDLRPFARRSSWKLGNKQCWM